MNEAFAVRDRRRATGSNVSDFHIGKRSRHLSNACVRFLLTSGDESGAARDTIRGDVISITAIASVSHRDGNAARRGDAVVTPLLV